LLNNAYARGDRFLLEGAESRRYACPELRRHASGRMPGFSLRRCNLRSERRRLLQRGEELPCRFIVEEVAGALVC
jgi:hypothetical protein